LQPRRASSDTIARPIPRVPPVTIADCFSNCFSLKLFSSEKFLLVNFRFCALISSKTVYGIIKTAGQKAAAKKKL
jgi:hypothetical protein